MKTKTKNKLHQWIWVIGLTFTCALILPGCGSNEDIEKDFRVMLFIDQGQFDFGWDETHYNGMLLTKASLNNIYLETENLGRMTEQEFLELIDSRIKQGYRMFFNSSLRYEEKFKQKAKEYSNNVPRIYFENCGRISTDSASNLANYYGRMYQARYLTGIVAAYNACKESHTQEDNKTVKIGFLTDELYLDTKEKVPNPAVVRGINAFTLGAQSVDIDGCSIKVLVKNFNTQNLSNEEELLDNINKAIWDLTKECTVLAQHSRHFSYLITIQGYIISSLLHKDICVIGDQTDLLWITESKILTSAIWNWTKYYQDRVKAAAARDEESWEAQNYWGGITEENSIINLGRYGDNVDEEVKEKVNNKLDELYESEEKIPREEIIFNCPIYKQNDHETLIDECEEGSTSSLTDDQMWNMHEFVCGVNVVSDNND